MPALWVEPGRYIVGNGQLDRFQPLDLVAQAGGLFEFQILGGLAHLRPQRVQMRGKVRPDHGLVEAGGDP